MEMIYKLRFSIYTAIITINTDIKGKRKMTATLSRNWWVLLVRGIAAILFGIAALIWPGLALVTLVLLFAAYAFVDGIFTIIFALQHRNQPRWWVTLIEGIIGVIAGIAAFLWPDMASFVLLNFIAFWAILTGIMEIILAIRLREEIQGEFWMGLGGLLSILFGVLILLFPGAGALSIVWMIAAYAIVFGVILVILAFRVRSLGDQGQTPNQTARTIG
jgi:uncharacterized membrane protein HdeD (DUF308 family)